jgi:hypothetical protein
MQEFRGKQSCLQKRKRPISAASDPTVMPLLFGSWSAGCARGVLFALLGRLVMSVLGRLLLGCCGCGCSFGGVATLRRLSEREARAQHHSANSDKQLLHAVSLNLRKIGLSDFPVS